MWTRIYLLLVLVRLYFAFSPSYIHPDENFQGPEVIAGRIYGFPNLHTWEFTASQPVRSVFPLWPAYGLPMVIIRWLWTGTSTLPVPPRIVYYTLRTVMFMLSFVLEDWAVHELVESPRHRRMAVTLVASSYVTWTYQTHTFSNSFETILVLWSLVLLQRIRDSKRRTSILSSILLGVILVTGTFNRITFPAFLIGPIIFALPDILRRPMTTVILALSGAITLLMAVATDTGFFRPSPEPWRTLLHDPVVAPYNSLQYNIMTDNLEQHGLHPRYTHLIANMPLLVAPALPLLARPMPSMRLLSAASGLVALSLLPHQEPRFLLPVIPLLLSSVRLPINVRMRNIFLAAWLGFNLVMGVLMGIFHQGGVVPMQLHLGSMTLSDAAHQPQLPPGSKVLWWKTYSPPVWLANSNASALATVDLMGQPASDVWETLQAEIGSCSAQKKRGGEIALVVPSNKVEVEAWRQLGGDGPAAPRESRQQAQQDLKLWPRADELSWALIGEERRHIGLDDLDFAEDGVWGTLTRVVGHRGLQAWSVRRRC